MDDPSTQGTEDDVFTFDSAANKTYPLCPEGIHKVIVAQALFEMRDNYKRTDKVPCVSLWLETRDAGYPNKQTNKDKPYLLFQTLKISDHKKSNMYEFFQKVMGITVPLVDKKDADGNVVKKMYLGERKVEKVEDKEDRVHMVSFENLEFSVSVVHEPREDGTKKDSIDSIVACSSDQKASNASLFRAPQA